MPPESGIIPKSPSLTNSKIGSFASEAKSPSPPDDKIGNFESKVDELPGVDVDALKAWNKLMERRAKAAMALADGVDEMCECLPKDAKHNIKSISKALAGTFRTAKAYRLCPACDGSGCPKCLGVGWCNKNRWEMITA
jgi:hypothetical protein